MSHNVEILTPKATMSSQDVAADPADPASRAAHSEILAGREVSVDEKRLLLDILAELLYNPLPVLLERKFENVAVPAGKFDADLPITSGRYGAEGPCAENQTVSPVFVDLNPGLTMEEAKEMAVADYNNYHETECVDEFYTKAGTVGFSRVVGKKD
ncbi:hypothetical protein FZEAL_1715 [Fusarium zealandicum]|uniref:Uncharacterized protein n=1 Tax=Fusarium zealandicum TaxID=1053134 RepID=A0A8H4US81_9HYPO|nr:hypothetical protein FZEAL_1715 [Fusarium zealandicum]